MAFSLAIVRRAWRIPVTAGVLIGMALAVGCATRRSDDLSDLLDELEVLHSIEAASSGVSEEASPLSGSAGPVRGVRSDRASGSGRRMADQPTSYASADAASGGLDPDAPDERDAGLSPLSGEDPIASVSAGSRPEHVREPSMELTNAAPSGELTIQPDCLVQVSVDEDPSLDGNYPVNKIGAISLRYVGPVILYNKSEQEAADKIAEVLRSRHFRKATVNVKILRASYDRVQVVGAVNRADLVKIGAGDSISLNDLLLRAGGVKPGTENPHARVVRGGLTSALAAALPGEEYSLLDDEGLPGIPEVYLRNNDLVQVYAAPGDGTGGFMAARQRGARQVLVLGEVKRPGVYRFSPREPCSILYLVFKMGGLPPYANMKNLRVMRLNDHGEEVEFTVDARDVLREGDPRDDFELQDGDRIVVPARRISLF